jgi:pyrroloquinoline quinone biosynthesis protein B
MRRVPIEAVALTDAELDHTIGVALLREARQLPLYATEAVREVLEEDSKILTVTRAFANVPVTTLRPGERVALCHRDGAPSGLTVESFLVAAGPPQFARHERAGHTVGLMLRAEGSGACAFVPGCGEVDSSLLTRLAEAELLLFDGTFWTDDELIALGISERTARQMDHLPLSGPGGSVEWLRALPCRHRVYTHINNTNPILLEGSSERAQVEAAGLVVGADGMQFTI